MISKTELNKPYPIALLLSTSARKSCESLGREMGLSGEKVSKLLDESSPCLEERIIAAKKVINRKKPYVIIDDTLIPKVYSKCIEGTSDSYCSSEHVYMRSLCSVTAMLTNGNVAIPVDQKIWISREMDTVNYATKITLAQQIIVDIKQYTDIEVVIMDGLYATKQMIQWLIDCNIKFEMKIASNRIIIMNNKRFKIRECPFFKLMGYRTERTLAASWQKMNLYFTAVKRWYKTGESTVLYLVSNYKTSAQNHKKIYKYRWDIEKFFRTAKQHLGLKDCQSLKLEKQKAHIFNVFTAYTIAQFERIKSKHKNVEEAIKSIKIRNLHRPDYAIKRFREVFRYV